MLPATKDAYRLFHEGSVALAEIECTGMPVCVEKLEASDKEITAQIRVYESELRETPIYSTQRTRFGKDSNVNSRDQLAMVLYQDIKLEGAKRSPKTGKYTLDDKDLGELQDMPGLTVEVNDYIKCFRKLQKLYKLKGTYLDGLRRETVNGRIHCFINLAAVETYRLSASDPNLNNLPTRDRVVAQHIKGAVIPAPGYCIVEIDYSALEVHIACPYHKDPTMMEYLQSGYDMHSDMAKECFMVEDAWVTANPKQFKQLRNMVKGLFTFAAFYGDYYASMAMGLWKCPPLVGLSDHMAAKGITRLGVSRDPATGQVLENGGDDAFVTHIKEVESRFWDKRFPVYRDWKRSFWANYKRNGYFHTLTGFRVAGVYKRNQVVNSPVQGSAAHCLLQSIIDIQREIKRRAMGARLIMEIHDSLLAEVPITELHEYVAMAREIMTTKLRQKWPWINIDLKVEVEVGYESWYHKEEYKGS